MSNLPKLHRECYREGVWSAEYIRRLKTVPSEPEDYPNALLDLAGGLQIYEENFGWDLDLDDILVIGSLTPWIECYLLRLGAKKVHVTDINPIQIESPEIVFVPEAELSNHAFDLVVTFSSIEHIGLGRYGDPLGDDNDLTYMHHIRDCMTAGGMLLLGVPVAETFRVDRPWHRLYDADRLQRLTEGFELQGACKNGRQSERIDFTCDTSCCADWQNQPVIIYRKSAS